MKWLSPAPWRRTPSTAQTVCSTMLVLDSLVSAQLWCVRHANRDEPITSLRHVELLPTKALVEDPTALVGELMRDPLTLVAHVSAVRSTRIAAGRPAPVSGRLVAYSPFDNLCDGAAEAESRGYLDVENAPPWDTWVAWSASGSDSGLLLAWVPADFVVDVESGIQVNTEQCIHWHPG
ncbi:MAG: hypothetical protein OXU20_07555 [Myxococcales bacterium]|nr:hypothetical protein [Myxococcales bacterium]